MVKVDKQNALFITGVVIACGEPDADGDILEKEDIKKLMSSYLSQKVDTNHDFLENYGVRVIENYTNKEPEKVADQTVPKNSWICKMMIWDESLKRDIRQKRLDGLSLASQPDGSSKDYKDVINKRHTYNDFNIDNLTPSFISIVKNPANGYSLEYYSYNSYITKSKKENNLMSDDNKDAMGDIAIKLVDALLEQNNNSKVIENNEAVTKAMPPQGGVAPQQMQQPQMQQPVSLEMINSKLDHLINMMGGGQQTMKSTETDEGEKTVDKSTEKDESEETVDKAEEKKGDVTKEPETNDNSVKPDEGVVGTDGKKEVEPSTQTEGTKPVENKKKQVLKSKEPVTNGDNVVSNTFTKTYIPEPNTTKRDVYGRPIRN